MSTDLSINDDFDLNDLLPDIVNPYKDLDDSELVTAGSFLPRVQLCIANSDPVKEGKIGINHYALVRVKGDATDLGTSLDTIAFLWRPRALDTKDKNNIRATSDIKSELWSEIKDLADNVNQSWCQYGKEYLLWLPYSNLFATMLFGSKSARIVSSEMDSNYKKPITLHSRLVKNNNYSWQVPTVKSCSTPFPFPTKEAAMKAANIFLNPKSQTGAEKAKEQLTRER